jgi:hypothetical protein
MPLEIPALVDDASRGPVEGALCEIHVEAV